MDLFFRREFRVDDFRWQSDLLRKVSRLSARTTLHLWCQISAGAFGGILPVGMAGVSIRCRAVALFVIFETMKPGPKHVRLGSFGI